MANNLSYKFYPHLEKPKGDKYSIYMRLSLNRKKTEYSVGYAIALQDWDEGKQRAKKKSNINDEINTELASLETKIIDIKKSLEKDNKLVSASTIKDILTEKHKLDAFIIELFEKYKEELDVRGEVKKVTIIRYNETKAHLINFLESKKKISDINVRYIDHTFIVDFGLFLSTLKIKNTTNNLKRNTINKHHSRLRTILIQARNNGFLQTNPYLNNKLKNEESTIVYLEKDELKKIENLDLSSNDSLSRVRDLFIFSCYTGLRFAQAEELKMDNIKIEKGKYWLRIDKIHKSGNYLGIPILKGAISIIKKYQDSSERKILNKVLPKITNQKFNVYIKIIADLAGVKKHLHHHVARHTCGTFLLSEKYSIDQVAAWLGQKDTRVTKIYAKITASSLDKMRDEIDKKKK